MTSTAILGRVRPATVAAWTFPFATVVFLAFENGGYDTVARSHVGIVAWSIVLFGAIAGGAPGRIGAPGWVAICLLAAFAAWIGVGIGQSESAERAALELGRVATYLGVLIVGLWLTQNAEWRHVLNGITSAVGIVTVVAVLSRLQPSWFPANDHLEFLPAAAGELSYPLNYWNLLGGLTALGIPLFLSIAAVGRTAVGQAVAAAILPVSVLCVYLTSSSGGMVAMVAAVAATLALAPRRGVLIGSLAVMALGGGILVAAAGGGDALPTGSAGLEPPAQGDAMSVLVVVVILVAGLLQLALVRAARHVRAPRRRTPSGRTIVIAAVIAAALAVAAAARGGLGERAREFARLPSSAAVVGDGRGGTGSPPTDIRYAFWDASIDAYATSPLRGIGAGSFEFWWARNGSEEGLFRDAHSLYLESLAELGLPGFVLITGFVLWLLALSVAVTLRSPPESRPWLAAATAGLVAFSLTAALEWAWEMAVLPVGALLLSAVVLAGGRDGIGAGGRASRSVRAGVACLALAALVAIALPLASTVALQDSRTAAREGRVDEALDAARTAARVQPYAATPKLQRALVLEQAGRLESAAVAARAATAAEPTNWRTWLVRARVDARRGRAVVALRELRRARQLSPRFTGFRGP